MKNRLRFHFDSETCLNYPFLNIFLVQGISSQNSSGFYSRNQSRKLFLLNWVPDDVRADELDGREVPAVDDHVIHLGNT